MISLGNIRHSYHLVDPSPWPFLASLSALFITIGAVMTMHFFVRGPQLLFAGIGFLIIILSLWWRDVIREGTYQGHHTPIVQKGLRLGFILFIISEIMFFFGFFWAYFHSSLAPTIWIGCVWPPLGIITFNPYEIPLLNTSILLLSGITLTIAHYSLLISFREESIFQVFNTIILAILFLLIQLYEYFHAPFSIADSVYGSVFYMLTGFHGFHVIVGMLFIIVCFYRLINYHFKPSQHIGFEAALWYWHFVDVVWLFLYIFVYIWGSK
jgi:cytochrome c oxidase subunit 3